MTNYSKIVYFKNWTDKDFTYKYDNQEQTFEAGQLYSLPAEIAQHFAHHLAVRECFRAGEKQEILPADKMKEYMDKCFPGGSVDNPERQGLPIDKVEIKDTHASDAPVNLSNTTESDIQKKVEAPEEDVRDNKVLKTKKSLKKSKDDEYQKVDA